MTDIPSTVLFSLKSKGVRFVRYTMVDNAGLIRSKAVNSALLPTFADGVGITPAQQALPVMYDAPSLDSGLTPAGEVFMRPDWSTLRLLPYAPGHARVLTDIFDGQRPWAHCTRSFLRRMIGQAARRGLEIKAAFENEFFLLRAVGDSWEPIDRTVFAQTAALDGATAVIDDIALALEAQGIVPEMVYSESGSGQFEMPVRYTDALGAADQQVAFRETVRAVAQRHGLMASFVPKVFVEQAGCGAHLHLSLWKGGTNVTGRSGRGPTLGREASAFAAGILDHLPALMTFTTPSTNSFKRIRPHFWSGAFTCWGQGNREAAIRVPPTGAGGTITNFELKTVDPSCNPYLALGAVIAAGLNGLTRGRRLGEPVNVDPATLPEEEREAREIRPLPMQLREALEALEQDHVLFDAVGPELFRSFTAVRRAEWEAMKDLPHEEEVRLLLQRY